MQEILQELAEREKFLTTLKSEKEKRLQYVPEGSLRVSKSKNRTQYFWRTNPKDFSGSYINSKNMELARKLAQKDYDQKIASLSEKEIKVIHRFLSSYPATNVEELIDSMHPEKQKLIHPIKLTDEMYIKQWEEVEYQGKEIRVDAAEIYTLKGERVRSKSEMMIADTLNFEGIPYRYEYPLRLKGVGIIYPDFTVLNIKQRKEYVWEHFGMMDDSVYAEKAIRKVISYEENGFFPGQNLILTYESSHYPMGQKQIKLMIQKYLS